jgi:hypothetical protein
MCFLFSLAPWIQVSQQWILFLLVFQSMSFWIWFLVFFTTTEACKHSSTMSHIHQSRNTGLMTKETTVIGSTTTHGKRHANVYVI